MRSSFLVANTTTLDNCVESLQWFPLPINQEQRRSNLPSLTSRSHSIHSSHPPTPPKSEECTPAHSSSFSLTCSCRLLVPFCHRTLHLSHVGFTSFYGIRWGRCEGATYMGGHYPGEPRPSSPTGSDGGDDAKAPPTLGYSSSPRTHGLDSSLPLIGPTRSPDRTTSTPFVRGEEPIVSSTPDRPSRSFEFHHAFQWGGDRSLAPSLFDTPISQPEGQRPREVRRHLSRTSYR